MAGPKEEGSPSQTLNCKTWILKVSIHCEGCKKKVKKVLNNIDGVYSVEVDSPKNKVTVTGNVDSDTLIKKLLKHGKHAEPWPVKEEKNNKKEKAGKSQEPTGKTQEPVGKNEKVDPGKTKTNGGKNEKAGPENNGGGGKKTAEKNETNGGKNEKASPENNGGGGKKTAEKNEPEAKTGGESKPTGGESKPNDGESKPTGDELKPNGGESKPTGGESKKSDLQENPTADSDGGGKKTAGGDNDGAETIGGVKSGVGEKRGKKVKKEVTDVNHESSGETSGSSHAPAPAPAVTVAAVQSFPEHPSHYHSLVPPVSVGYSGRDEWSFNVNYNTTYPNASYGTYILPQADNTAYMYDQYGGTRYDEGYQYRPENRQLPPEEYHLFSDENANACCIM